MQLPIDATSGPFRQKYLDETRILAPWFIFGHSGFGVDIADESGDVIIKIGDVQAKRLIEAREQFLAEVSDILALK